MFEKHHCCKEMKNVIDVGTMFYHPSNGYSFLDQCDDEILIKYCPFCGYNISKIRADDIMASCDICRNKDIYNILKFNKIKEICPDCWRKIKEKLIFGSNSFSAT